MKTNKMVVFVGMWLVVAATAHVHTYSMQFLVALFFASAFYFLGLTLEADKDE